MGIQKRPLYAAQLSSQAYCTEISSCHSPCLPEFSSALTAHSCNSEIPGVWRVVGQHNHQYTAHVLVRSLGDQQTLEKASELMLRDALSIKPLAGVTKLQTSVLGKAHPNQDTLHKRHITVQEPCLQLRWGRRQESKSICITDWNPPEMNHFI